MEIMYANVIMLLTTAFVKHNVRPNYPLAEKTPVEAEAAAIAAAVQARLGKHAQTHPLSDHKLRFVTAIHYEAQIGTRGAS